MEIVSIPFMERVHCWDREYNAANIVLFTTSPIPDILYVSSKEW